MAASELLVSVRSALEAEAALQGGADIIDVKEPMNGPLGRSDISTISAVTGFVQHRMELRVEPRIQPLAAEPGLAVSPVGTGRPAGVRRGQVVQR